MSIGKKLLSIFGGPRNEPTLIDLERAFARPKLAPGIYGQATMAMDEGPGFTSEGLEQLAEMFGGDIRKAMRHAFIGYPALAALQQDGLVQAVVSTLTEELLRKWVSLEGEGADKIDDALKKYKVRPRIEEALTVSGYQGGCLLYIDLGDQNDAELAMPLTLDSGKIPQGSLRGFKPVEPYYAGPYGYQAVNPIAENFMQPSHWYVGGRKCHASRFIYFAWNRPSALLRPNYNFFGIPLPQLLLPYMRNFERARDAAAELVYNYSLLGLKTDLAALTQPGGVDGETDSGLETLRNRVAAFLGGRNNNALAVIDKNNEEFFQINTPLTGVEGLVSQNVELLAFIPRTPITKLFGFSPRGFNATGEHEENNFNNRLGSMRPFLLEEQFAKARAVVELSEFGQINPAVVEKWPDYADANPLEEAQISLFEAQRDQIYTTIGVASPREVRVRLADDPASGFAGINPNNTPPPVDLADPSLTNATLETLPISKTPEERAAALTNALRQSLGQPVQLIHPRPNDAESIAPASEGG